MADSKLAHLLPSKPQVQGVQVIDHQGRGFNWDDYDWHTRFQLIGLTLSRAEALAEKARPGYWFLTPRYSVFAPEPSARFFRAVRQVQGLWMSAFRRRLYRQWREVISDLAEIEQRFVLEEHGLTPPPKGQPWSGVDPQLECFLRQLGRGLRYLLYSGYMVKNGEPMEPKEWTRLESRYLDNDDSARVIVNSYAIDLSELKENSKFESVMASTRSELHSLLAYDPSAAHFVVPGSTVSAPTLSEAFLTLARKAEKRWNYQLNKSMGTQRRQLARSADLATRMLVFQGVLVVAGRCYLPGSWPQLRSSKARTRDIHFDAETVPVSLLIPDYDAKESCRPGNSSPQPKSFEPWSTAGGHLNEHFKSLLDSDGSSPP